VVASGGICAPRRRGFPPADHIDCSVTAVLAPHKGSYGATDAGLTGKDPPKRVFSGRIQAVVVRSGGVS
jgi:hypothetical protein